VIIAFFFFVSSGLRASLAKQVLYLFFFYYSFIHVYIHCLGHFSPLALPLELHLQSILLGYFGDGGLVNYLPMLTLNPDSPNLTLPNV
jgi:hypothetical protein